MTIASMDYGYPTEADILTWLSSNGIEPIPEYANPFITDFRKFAYGILNSLRWAMSLGVYCPSVTTFNVRSGDYLFAGQVKTFAAGSAVDPTDSDTTYIWMKPDNTIGSGIDGDGWPATEHIKLAAIIVDGDGAITAVTDLRGQAFLNYAATALTAAGASVEALVTYWNSAEPC